VQQDLMMPTRRSHQLGEARRDRLNALYERHYLNVLRYAWRRVGADDAEDIANETFTVAWRRLDEVPVSGDLPWLYAVAGNVIRNYGRRAQRDTHVVAALTPSAEPDHAEAVQNREVALGVLSRLSEEDRELVRLVAWEGLDGQQIAAVLGCSRAVARFLGGRPPYGYRLVDVGPHPNRPRPPTASGSARKLAEV
jgi:RNA polymerase sigma-70 factor (ECF subfamily)